MLGRIIFSAATVFGAWCAVKASVLVENDIVRRVMELNFPNTSFPLVAVVAFFIVLRITFWVTHQRRCCKNTSSK